MVAVSAHRQSAQAVLKGVKTLRTATNKTWNLAPKAPMFTRKSKNDKGKKKVVRTKRLIGGHSWKILASGAAAYANAVLQREAAALRVQIGTESKRVPWLPSVSKGAIALCEQFMCAYAQEATRNAVDVRVGLGKVNKSGEHIDYFKRLNGKCMKIGYDQADECVFGASMLAPRTMVICKPEKKKDGKKGEDKEGEDYQPPQAD